MFISLTSASINNTWTCCRAGPTGAGEHRVSTQRYYVLDGGTEGRGLGGTIVPDHRLNALTLGDLTAPVG